MVVVAVDKINFGSWGFKVGFLTLNNQVSALYK